MFLDTPTSLKNKTLLKHINLNLYNKQSIISDFHFLKQFALQFKSKPLCVGLRHIPVSISTLLILMQTTKNEILCYADFMVKKLKEIKNLLIKPTHSGLPIQIVLKNGNPK